MITNHFIVLWGRQPIGLDSNSGGYPYKTNNPNQIKFWSSKQEAELYVKALNYADMVIRKIKFDISEYEQ